jgi:membrane-bound acyltransferase YfiQ involved in biofilm formation
VRDLQVDKFYERFFEAIHGFRMPLFFLVSGFFTMMLFRRRGLDALLEQRFKRVFIPCLIGFVTIVPMMGLVSVWAMDRASRQDAQRKEQKSPLVEAIRNHDLSALQRESARGPELDRVDPEFGMPPLSWAALYGDLPTVQMLLDRGANVNATSRDGYNSLHSAAFLGYPKVLELLLLRGGDPTARGMRNDTAQDSTKADWNTTQGICYFLRVPLRSEKEIQAGRVACQQLLANPAGEGKKTGLLEGILNKINQEYSVMLSWFPSSQSLGLEQLREGYRDFLTSSQFSLLFSPGGKPVHLILTNQFDHLWFLWFLCWLVLIFAGCAWAAHKLSIPRLPPWLILSPLRWLWLVPLLMIPQLFMGIFGLGFGPDTSTGVLPQPHLLIYYGIFFFYGALYFECDDSKGRLGRGWWLILLLAMVIGLPMAVITRGQLVPSAIVQVFYAWLMVFGLMGLFRKLLSKEYRIIRYISDSAYWLYIVHLPLVVLLQALIREWDWPALVKFLFICIVVTACLLFTYQTMVRYRWLGRLLNGPRTRSSEKRPLSAPHCVIDRDGQLEASLEKA